jgi:hypothetical protein
VASTYTAFIISCIRYWSIAESILLAYYTIDTHNDCDMKFSQSLTALAASAQLGYAMDLDVSSPDSIRSAASTIAHGLMNYYQNNKTDTPEASIGTLPHPLYWWEAGAVWGGLIDYWAYTKDTSFNDVVMQALMAQTGTGNDFLPEAYYSSMVRIVSRPRASKTED